jgi:hypothetical protein
VITSLALQEPQADYKTSAIIAKRVNFIQYSIKNNQGDILPASERLILETKNFSAT